jgi:hypothetical protein
VVWLRECSTFKFAVQASDALVGVGPEEVAGWRQRSRRGATAARPGDGRGKNDVAVTVR